MLNKTPWTVRWKHLKQWYYGNTTKEERGQNPEICGLKKEKKGSWQMESGRLQAQGPEGMKAWIQEWEGETRFGKV